MFRFGTKRYFIAAMQANGLTNIQAYNELKSLVARQVSPWIFKSNVPGEGRVAKPLSLQYQELQNEINRVYSLIERTGNPIPSGTEIPRDENDATEEDSDESKEEIKTDEKPVVKSSKARKDSEKQHFYNEWKRLRHWISTTVENTGAVAVDSLDTMRPLQAAKTMIDAGISARTMLYAMCMHWPKATLDMAGISPVDFNDESSPIYPGAHHLSGYVCKLIEARQNVMLIGAAGTGKSFLARQVAEHLNLPYGETPMTPGATRGDLLGRHTLQGFVPSQFVEIYSGGGVFNFEEIDASDPSMLIVVNNALASGYLFNSVNGERYERHENFVAVSTANTFGLGADSKYTGREKLDLATIDRFRMGRVLVSLDEDLARNMILA
jgi:hypothetical protein